MLRSTQFRSFSLALRLRHDRRVFSFTSSASFTSFPKTFQLRHLSYRQRPIFPRRHVQNQRPQLHPLDFFHQKSNALKHPPDLTVSSFDQNHLIPWIRPVLHQPYFRWRCLHPCPILQFNRDSRPQTLNRPLVWLSADFHQIRLRRVRAGLHQFLRQRSIIRHQQQPFAGVVQPPHRIHSLATILYQLHHPAPPLGISDRGHIAFRLVQQEIQQPLSSLQRRAIHANHLSFPLRLRSLFHHHFSV